MKAFQFIKPFEAKVVEVAKPQIKHDEVLIKVGASGFCGTDIHTYKGEHPTEYPVIPGHELSGIIEETGDSIQNYHIGDKVVVDPNIFCEKCYYCKRNQQIHCEDLKCIGNTRDGAFAEYVAVPEACLFKISESADLITMSLAEPLACVISSHNKVAIGIGKDVLIFGAGTIGLMHLMIAKRRGAGTVTIVDIKQGQLDLAKKLGADHTVLSDSKLEEKLREICPRGFLYVFEATGIPKVAEFAFKMLATTGTLIQFGACPIGSKMEVDPQDIYIRELKIVGSYSMQKAMPQAIELIESGNIDLNPLIGDIISIDEMESKFSEFINGKTEKKVVLKF